MLVEQLKRWAATGLGIALLTKERAEAMISELVRRGEISPEEGKDLFDSPLRRAQEEKDELQRRIDAAVRRVIESAGVASREDVRRLEDRLARLEARLERLEASRAPDPSEGG